MSSADDPRSNGAFFTACLVTLLLGIIGVTLVIVVLLWVVVSVLSANVELIQW